jgi:hypothetical protein
MLKVFIMSFDPIGDFFYTMKSFFKPTYRASIPILPPPTRVNYSYTYRGYNPYDSNSSESSGGSTETITDNNYRCNEQSDEYSDETDYPN